MPKRGGKAAHDQAFRPSSKVIIKFLMVLQKHGDLHGVQKVLNLNLWVSFLLQAKKYGAKRSTEVRRDMETRDAANLYGDNVEADYDDNCR
ncbi:hypothetical protein R6Q57_011192 [Mikania cordata]